MAVDREQLDETPDAALDRAMGELVAGLDRLGAVELRDCAPARALALVRELELLARRLAGETAKAMATVESEGLWATDGARSFTAWVRRATDASTPVAHAQSRTARALRDHLPEAADALSAGRISAEHAALLAKHTTRTPERLAALADAELGEAFLVHQAAVMDASDFSKLVRAWAIRVDPAGADAQWKGDLSREELVLARTLDGWHLQGWLGDASGVALDAALRAHIGVPAPGDDRTTPQRRAAALVALARRTLDSGELGSGPSTRPQVSVHVPFETLQRLAAAQGEGERTAGGAAERKATAEGEPNGDGECVIPGDLDLGSFSGAVPAELDDGTPLPPSLLSRLACDSSLARVVFGPKGEVLDAGRAKRLFPPVQRRAVIARDRRCQFPGCDAPPYDGEVHHSIWWFAQYGKTRVKDGVLLCWFHHDHVHAHKITVSWKRGADGAPGGWQFRRRNGALITDTGAGRRMALLIGPATPGIAAPPASPSPAQGDPGGEPP